MLLESDVRSLIALSLFVPLSLFVAGCDRETAPVEQAQDINAKPVPPTAKKSFGLESANGMKAELSYAFAGKPAPDVAFTGADGREVALPDFVGRPLLVNLWATWCGPCKVEMPSLDRLAVLEEGQLSVIAVSQDLQGRKPVQRFFESAQISNLEPYTDPENRLSAAVGGQIALPMTILYNGEGKEVWRVIGGVEWDDAEMAKLIDEAG
jgi:thiol-disulfide isomerase/thioredoxin